MLIAVCSCKRYNISMSVDSFLENMRAKPDHVKRRFAFWSSISLTAIIFVFWIASLTALGTSRGDSVVATTVKKADSPGYSLVAGVGSFFVDIKDIIFGPKFIEYETVELLPGNK